MKCVVPILVAVLLTPGFSVWAQPSISLVDNVDGTATLKIFTDAPGALAAELGLVAFGGISILEVTVNSDLFDDPNPGDNPFIEGSPLGGDSEGLYFDEANSQVFASFGSDDLGVGAFDFITFSYVNEIADACGSSGINVSGIVAQNGVTGDVLSGGYGTAIDCFSDFDGNGAVGDGDLTLLLGNWQKSVPPIPAGWVGGSLTAPNVGDDELTALLGAWGAGSSSATVPEPTAGLLLMLGLMPIATRRNR